MSVANLAKRIDAHLVTAPIHWPVRGTCTDEAYRALQRAMSMEHVDFIDFVAAARSLSIVPLWNVHPDEVELHRLPMAPRHAARHAFAPN